MKLSEIHRAMQALSGMEEKELGSSRAQELLRQIGFEPEALYQELEMESRYVDTHRDESRFNDRVQLHSHSFYELIYCRNTCGVEYLVGSERYRLQRGDIVFVPPGVSHRPLLPEIMTEPYKRYVLWLSPEFIRSLSRQFSDAPGQPRPFTGFVRTAGTPWESLRELFREGVREAEEKQPGWEAAVMGNTVCLLARLQRAMLDARTLPLMAEAPELLDRVMAYIEEHLSGRITLAETARNFYVSESTVSQLFRRKMGVSFYRCVTQRRLIAAKTLIQKNLPMEAVAQQVGFTDYSAFYRAFRQEYGISPRQYRKLQEQERREER